MSFYSQICSRPSPSAPFLDPVRLSHMPFTYFKCFQARNVVETTVNKQMFKFILIHDIKYTISNLVFEPGARREK